MLTVIKQLASSSLQWNPVVYNDVQTGEQNVEGWFWPSAQELKKKLGEPLGQANVSWLVSISANSSAVVHQLARQEIITRATNTK